MLRVLTISSILIFLSVIFGFVVHDPSSIAQDGMRQLPAGHPPTSTPTVPTVMSAKELFVLSRCVRCHTIGRGRFVGPDLLNVGDKYSKDEIIQWIMNSQALYAAKGKMPVNEGYPPMPPMSVPQPSAESIAGYLLDFKPADVPDASAGTISGFVMNNTTEQPASGVEIVLKSFMGDKEQSSADTVTDENGRFRFDDLTWLRSYQVLISHNGGSYASDKMVFYPDESEKTLNLPIYETTVSDDNISVVAGHMIVQFIEGRISVAEIAVIHNASKLLYIGQSSGDESVKETLRFTIPKGAENISLIQGLSPDQTVRREGSLIDLSPVSPGMKRIVFSYTLPLQSAKIQKSFKYPTANFSLIVQETQQALSVVGLTAEESIMVEDVRFSKWAGTKIAVGNTATLTISVPFDIDDYMPWIAGAVFALVLGAGIVYSFTRGEDKQSAASESEASIKTLEYEKLRLITEIAELDDKFEAGEIKESQYRDLRHEKKARAVELTVELEKRKEPV